ncbi:MAG: hypothetical protein ACI9XO_001989 [Paraglaciecola sp.]|jgi:hypothetical protein
MKAQFSLGLTGGLNFSDRHNQNLPEDFNLGYNQVIYQYFCVIPKYQLSDKISVSCNVEFS